MEGQGLGRVGSWIKPVCSLGTWLLWETLEHPFHLGTPASATLILQHLLRKHTGGDPVHGNFEKTEAARGGSQDVSSGCCFSPQAASHSSQEPT